MTRVEKPKKTWVTVSDTVRGCPLCVFGHERVRDFFLSRKNLVVPTVHVYNVVQYNLNTTCTRVQYKLYSSERRRELRGAVAVTPRARVIRLPRRSTPHLRSRCPRRSRCAWSPPGCTSSSSRRPCRPRYRDSSKSATSRRCTRTRSASRGWAAAGTCAAGCATHPPRALRSRACVSRGGGGAIAARSRALPLAPRRSRLPPRNPQTSRAAPSCHRITAVSDATRVVDSKTFLFSRTRADLPPTLTALRSPTSSRARTSWSRRTSSRPTTRARRAASAAGATAASTTTFRRCTSTSSTTTGSE